MSLLLSSKIQVFIFIYKGEYYCEHFLLQGNQRNASRVLLTINNISLRSNAYPCADRLIFRDLKNDLSILDMSGNKLKATGNFTSNKGKGYLCQLQFEVRWVFYVKGSILKRLYRSRRETCRAQLGSFLQRLI